MLSGNYCPGGTDREIPCPAGTYSADGASSCTNTDAGFYSIKGTSDAVKAANACAEGFYCPEGSTGPTMVIEHF
jgi:hypothetical protein